MDVSGQLHGLAPSTQWIGEWVCFRANLDVVGRENVWAAIGN
jgi:hypothetical protein